MYVIHFLGGNSAIANINYLYSSLIRGIFARKSCVQYVYSFVWVGVMIHRNGVVTPNM